MGSFRSSSIGQGWLSLCHHSKNARLMTQILASNSKETFRELSNGMIYATQQSYCRYRRRIVVWDLKYTDRGWESPSLESSAITIKNSTIPSFTHPQWHTKLFVRPGVMIISKLGMLPLGHWALSSVSYDVYQLSLANRALNTEKEDIEISCQ